MRWGPNGDIYLIDWHDQNPCHQATPDDWDYEHGRVYRIQLKGTKTKKAEDLGKKTDERNCCELASTTTTRTGDRTALAATRRASSDGPRGEACSTLHERRLRKPSIAVLGRWHRRRYRGCSASRSSRRQRGSSTSDSRYRAVDRP